MILTQAQMNALAAGETLDLGEGSDPLRFSFNAILPSNARFDTPTGDERTFQLGSTSLTVTRDLSFDAGGGTINVRNGRVSVADDFFIFGFRGGAANFSGPSALLNMTGLPGNANYLSLSPTQDSVLGTSESTMFVSDGATVRISNADTDANSVVEVGTLAGTYFAQNGQVVDAERSVDATLVIEGAATSFALGNDASTFQGYMRIGEVYPSNPSASASDPFRQADGRVFVRDGADVSVRRLVVIGDGNNIGFASAEGLLIVEGAGTTFTVGSANGTGRNGIVSVGENGGDGQFVLRGGAEFTLLRGSDFGGGFVLSKGGNADAIIAGQGTRFVAEDGFVEVSNDTRSGALLVTDGAYLQTSILSSALGGSGTITIEGAQTRVDVEGTDNPRVIIGSVNIDEPDITTSNGTLTVRDGAELNVRKSIFIGLADERANPNVNGTLIIEGAGTTVTAGSETRTGDAGYLSIGQEGGTGALILRDGAALRLLAGDDVGGLMMLGGTQSASGGEATVQVSGAGTALLAEGQAIALAEAADGVARLALSDGAHLETVVIENGRLGTGDLLVEGAGTSLVLQGTVVSGNVFGAFLTTGRDGTGTFTLRDGADLSITGDGGTHPGFQAGRNAGSYGRVTIEGAGTTVTIDGADNVETGAGESGFIRAGREAGADGAILIRDGAIVTNETTGRLTISELAGAKGAVTVTGSGTRLDFGALASVGQAGTKRADALLTVSDGGHLRGREVFNNGIVDLSEDAVFEADLIQDNILRSSAGIEDVLIDGDLTSSNGSLGVDVSAAGAGIAHDTYTATGDVYLQGRLVLMVDDYSTLPEATLEVLSGASISSALGFRVHVVAQDANALTQDDMPAYLAAFETAPQLAFELTQTGLLVDFSNLRVIGTPQAETLNGTLVDDYMRGLGGSDSLSGGTGNDTIDGGFGFDTLLGGDGNDILNGQQNADFLLGGAGDDSLIGLDGPDRLAGEAGNDTLVGGSGADRLFGGAGDDLIHAGANFGTSVDGVEGGAGNDTIFGDGGYDLLRGGVGDDVIDGGNQADDLRGEDGNDTLMGGAGFDRLFGGQGDDLLIDEDGFGGLFGGSGNDTIQNGASAVNIFGGAGNDLIEAGAGHDNITGNAGFDTLNGGAGDDTLRGAFNADTFVFADGHGSDIILDFDARNAFEKIDLSAVTALTALADLDLASDVNGAATQHGADVVIDTGAGNSVTLLNVSLSDLDAGDFLF